MIKNVLFVPMNNKKFLIKNEILKYIHLFYYYYYYYSLLLFIIIIIIIIIYYYF